LPSAPPQCKLDELILDALRCLTNLGRQGGEASLSGAVEEGDLEEGHPPELRSAAAVVDRDALEEVRPRELLAAPELFDFIALALSTFAEGMPCIQASSSALM
jgi:hypothetical protein